MQEPCQTAFRRTVPLKQQNRKPEAIAPAHCTYLYIDDN